MVENAGNIAIKNERRIYAAMGSVIAILAGIWLQNQYTTLMKQQTDLTEFMKFASAKYVDNNMLLLIQNENTRRFDALQRQIERTLDAIEKRHPPGRTPLGSGFDRDLKFEHSK